MKDLMVWLDGARSPTPNFIFKLINDFDKVIIRQTFFSSPFVSYKKPLTIKLVVLHYLPLW